MLSNNDFDFQPAAVLSHKGVHGVWGGPFTPWRMFVSVCLCATYQISKIKMGSAACGVSQGIASERLIELFQSDPN